MDIYTLKKNGQSDEHHLFEAHWVKGKEGETCKVVARSICNKMASSDATDTPFACQDEDSARTQCAKRGRSVCGICVSHLYATPE